MNKAVLSEIKKQSKEFSVDENKLKVFLNELFTFNSDSILRDMGNQEETLDEKDALPDEFWEEIINNINESYSELEKGWEEDFLTIKFQILCNKFFTKKDLVKIDNIENRLRIDIKKYFSSLQNSTSKENFKERFFNLPTDILVDFVRYILNSSKELNKKLSIAKEEAQERIKELKKLRWKTIKKIQFISNKNISVLDLKSIKELFDNGVFYEDNLLNRGVNEFLYKLLNHPIASDNVAEFFNLTFVNDFTSNIEKSNSYLNHIESIREEETTEFFSLDGMQIGRRFDNEIETVEKKDFSDVVIDKDSIFKEPKGRLNATSFNWGDTNGAPDTATDDSGEGGGSGFGGGGGGGGFSGGGGGGTFSGPTGGDETVSLDEPVSDGETPMPTGKDGLPVDFGSEESNEVSDDTDNNDEKNPAAQGQ